MKKSCLILIIILLLLTGCKTKKYTVTFLDDNQELSSIEVKKGDNIEDVPNPTKEGYLFLSWLMNGLEYDVTTPITKDITLTASWTDEPELPNNHTVTFNFGTYTKTQTVKDGEKATEPKEVPKKEKHKFLGWYVGETLYDFDLPVEKDIVIAAKYEKNRLIITFDLNGGTGSTVEIEIEKNTIPTKPKDPTKFGYSFANWTIDGEVYKFDTPLLKDTTIKANYIANVYYKVTFDSDGGTEIPVQMIIENGYLEEVAPPIKEGYTFKYWSYCGKEFDLKSPINEDITLIAIYETNEE